MTAKEYLEQVRHKQTEISNLCRDKESMREMLFSLGGCAAEGERVQSSRNIDKYGSLYGCIDEMDRKIDKQIAELIEFKMKVSREINDLKTDRYMIVLNCRYIHFMSWEDIADSAFGSRYSVRHILKIHGLALLEFQKKYKKILETEE